MIKEFTHQGFLKGLLGTVLAIFVLAGVGLSLFSAIRLTNVVLETYVFEAKDCYYRGLDDEWKCREDENAVKKDLARNVGILIFALPTGVIAYRQMRRLGKEK